MADAARVQRRLYDISRDHWQCMEEKHEDNMLWLQRQCQRLCKQLDIYTRIEWKPTRQCAFPYTAPSNKGVGVSQSPPGSKRPRVAATPLQDITRTAIKQPHIAMATPLTETTSTVVKQPRGTLPDVVSTAIKQPRTAPMSDTSSSAMIEPRQDTVINQSGPTRMEKRSIKRMVTRTRKVLRPVCKSTKQPRPEPFDFSALKVVQLKSELKKRGLVQGGNKAILVERLRAALAQEDENDQTENEQDDVEEMEMVEETYEEEIEEEVEVEVEMTAEEKEETDEVIEEKEKEKDEVIILSTLPKGEEKEDSQAVVAEVQENQNVVVDVNEVLKQAVAEVAEVQENQTVVVDVNEVLSDQVLVEQEDVVMNNVEEVGMTEETMEIEADVEIETESAVLEKISNIEVPDNSSLSVVPLSQELEIEEKKLQAVEEDTTSPDPVQVITNVDGNDVDMDESSLVSTVTSPGPDSVSTTTCPLILSSKELVSESSTKQQVSLSERNEESAQVIGTHSTSDEFEVTIPSDPPVLASAETPSPDRRAGSTSFVADSQPESPRLSIPTVLQPLCQHDTRISNVSTTTSFVEETPSKSTAVITKVVPATPSEPHTILNVTLLEQSKALVMDEAERKRREHQENVEREAQLLRMAAKQSAKKRYEESKASSLFWAKREQMKLQMQMSSGINASPKQVRQPMEQESIAKQQPVHVTKPSPPRICVQPSNVQGEKSKILQQNNMKGSDLQIQIHSKKEGSVLSTSTPVEQIKPSQKEQLPLEERLPERSLKRKSRNDFSDMATVQPTSKKRVSLSKITEPPVKRLSRSKKEMTPQDHQTRVMSSSVKTSRVSLSKSVASKVTTPLPVASSVSSASSSSSSQSKSRRDSISSNSSSTSSKSNTESSKSAGRVPVNSSSMSRTKPSNLKGDLHSFTSLLEKSSSQPTSSRPVPMVNALKLAEKSRVLEQKKTQEKLRRKEALMKKYEEQRRLDEEKKKKLALLREKAEKEARQKREMTIAEKLKQQRETALDAAKKRRLMEMRAGLDKKKGLVDKEAKQNPVQTTASRSTTINTPRSKADKKVPAARTASPVTPGVPTSYAISECESDVECPKEEDEDDDDQRDSKNVPKWAQREYLERTLRIQCGPNAIDPTPSIFPEFIDTCDLEAIFQPTDVRKKKRFQRRTSSGNWLGDRPTAREKAIYKRDMGFQR